MKFEDYSPAVKYGARISLDTIAGMAGLPVISNIFYVDAVSGNDTTNGGRSWEDAFKTLAQAENVATSNIYDVIVIAPSGVGGAGGTDESANITWDKNHITVLGGTAPVDVSQRAKIEWTTDSVDPGLTITGQGNRFIGVQFITLQASNDVLVSLTGSRNYFGGVHFAGIGNATAGDDATARCIALSGAEENLFEGCTLGLDTVARSTTNATVSMASQCARNIFRNSKFIMHADNVGPNHLLITGASGIQRWNEFNNCTWYSHWTNNGDKVTHVVDAAAQTATGHILMTGRQVMVGFDDWEAADSGRLYFEPASSTANAIGIAINPAVT